MQGWRFSSDRSSAIFQGKSNEGLSHGTQNGPQESDEQEDYTKIQLITSIINTKPHLQCMMCPEITANDGLKSILIRKTF